MYKTCKTDGNAAVFARPKDPAPLQPSSSLSSYAPCFVESARSRRRITTCRVVSPWLFFIASAVSPDTTGRLIGERCNDEEIKEPILASMATERRNLDSTRGIARVTEFITRACNYGCSAVAWAEEFRRATKKRETCCTRCAHLRYHGGEDYGRKNVVWSELDEIDTIVARASASYRLRSLLSDINCTDGNSHVHAYVRLRLWII